MSESAAVLHLSFEGGAEPFPGCLVHRAVISASVAAPYLVTLIVLSTDPAIAPESVLGVKAELEIDDEPCVDRVPGIVSQLRQLTSLSSPSGGVASYYEVSIVPEHFLLTKREGRRIHQHRDPVEVTRQTIAACPVALDPPIARLAGALKVREYTVQYDETDLDFIFRVLADQHLTSFFDPRQNGAFVVVDDPSSMTEVLPFRVPYRLPSNLIHEGPCAHAVRLDDAVASGSLDIRDYDAEHPAFSRSVPVALRGNASVKSSDAPFKGEANLAREEYEVGRFSDAATGDTIARRDLLASRAAARVIECDLNFALFPGTRFSIDDHPRAELADELVAIEARIIIDDGQILPIGSEAGVTGGGGRAQRSYSVRAVRAASGYAPPRRVKPRALGTETAFVVGALGDGHVDIDDEGRALVAFIWDRRDQRSGEPTRRVRISQAWAGANRGHITLPRIGDEVLISYDGGDPEEPIITGRVHNAISPSPQKTPDPDKTVSSWQSQTIGGTGFNLVLMDDKPGGERLKLRAQQTRIDETLGDEHSTIGGDFTQQIGHDAKIKVDGSTDVTIDGDLKVTAGETTIDLKKLDTTVHGDETRKVAGDVDSFAQSYTLIADKITLMAGGSSILLSKDGIAIIAPKVTIVGGTVTINGNTVTINGGTIALNQG